MDTTVAMKPEPNRTLTKLRRALIPSGTRRFDVVVGPHNDDGTRGLSNHRFGNGSEQTRPYSIGRSGSPQTDDHQVRFVFQRVFHDAGVRLTADRDASHRNVGDRSRGQLSESRILKFLNSLLDVLVGKTRLDEILFYRCS